MELKSGQVSIFEIGALFLVFSSFVVYLSFQDRIDYDSNIYQNQLDSYIDVLLNNHSLREKIFLENLSNSVLDQDWSLELGDMNKVFNNVEFWISSKNISSCEPLSGKISTSRFLVSNNSISETRTISLEVCY